ncbi:WD40 repeat domain-containing protein [Streptomyces malaysiensis subsp. malaysiensis]
MAVTVSDEDVARVWDLTTHTLHIDFPVASADDQDDGEHMRSVACATVDGRPVAVIAKDLAVRVWDLTTGAPRATLTGHSGEVSSVACTEVDGRPVAVTAGHDGVRVWDLTSGALYAAFVAALDGEGDSVEALACATVDGRPVAVTTSGNAMLRVWDLAGAAGGTCRTTATPTTSPRWRAASWTAARSPSPPAVTPPCTSGIWPPAPSARPSPGTAAPCGRWPVPPSRAVPWRSRPDGKERYGSGT